MRYPAPVVKPSVKSSTRVCLLSSHAYFLTQFGALLSKAGFETEVCRLDNTLPINLNSLALPQGAVYVLDASAPAQTVLAAHVLNAFVKSQLIIVAEQFEESTAFPLLELGVKGLLTYTEASAQLPRALHALAEGGYWVPRKLLSRFVEWILRKGTGQRRRIPHLGHISHREQQILEALLHNRSNKEIANELNISERTVKFHVSNLLSKYGVQRRADLILLVFQHGNTALSIIQ